MPNRCRLIVAFRPEGGGKSDQLRMFRRVIFFFFFLLQSGFQFRILLNQETTKLLPPVLIRFDRKKLAVVLDIRAGYKLFHSPHIYKEYRESRINKMVDQRAALKICFARTARRDPRQLS